ncbi:glycine betaine ABC transporter substrate-binding protein [Persicobacter diffluens]|uniref:Glycine/betaine ABC transporter n=1 Tax=Persicobacter diffluens TaxID=981 RepID=A0AAN5AKS0_9BACT|nr:glycine/betaine ABC transporter [Persicobacter diffluens]
MRLCLLSFLFLILSFFNVSCGSQEQKQQVDQPQFTIAYANWAESVAMTYLVKHLFEEKGYEVRLVNASIDTAFALLADGSADLFLDAWLPNTHASFVEQYQDQLEDLGVTVAQTKLGLMVPEYMANLDDIAQLNDYKKELGGRIVGIDPKSGLHILTQKAMEVYQLDYELQATTGPQLVDSLRKAMEEKMPILVTGWFPHYMITEMGMKFLDDPLLVYGSEEKIHALSRTGFAAEDPKIKNFFQNFKLTNYEIASLMQAFENKAADPEEVAQAWVEENRGLVNSWFNRAH